MMLGTRGREENESNISILVEGMPLTSCCCRQLNIAGRGGRAEEGTVE